MQVTRNAPTPPGRTDRGDNNISELSLESVGMNIYFHEKEGGKMTYITSGTTENNLCFSVIKLVGTSIRGILWYRGIFLK